MTPRREFTYEEALELGRRIGVDWSAVDREEFRRGLAVEMEHGRHDPQTNVTNDNPVLTAKIALAHLKEIRDYYTRLERMEAEAQAEVAKHHPLKIDDRRRL